MRWLLQLVETGTDSRTRSVEVLEISRPNDLGDIANLGLTLPEAKQLLARVQQAVVAAQAQDHAGLRPDCSACGGGCHVKNWRLRKVATLFGGYRGFSAPAVAAPRRVSARHRISAPLMTELRRSGALPAMKVSGPANRTARACPC